MGAGGSPCGVARAGGFAVGPALATPQGLPTAPNMGGAEGDLQGAIIGRAFVDNRHPLGWGAGLQGRWRHRPPLLLHWDIRILGGLGARRTALADTAQTTRAVYRPTLEPP